MDHSVVDVETIEALYENVGIAANFAAVSPEVQSPWSIFYRHCVRERSQGSWRRSRNTTRHQQKKTLSCWTNLNSQYHAGHLFPDGTRNSFNTILLFSRFLYELAQIPEFAGRANCIIFQSAFIDGIESIKRKLNMVSSVCKVGETPAKP